MAWMFAIIRIICTKFQRFPYRFIYSFVCDTTTPAYILPTYPNFLPTAGISKPPLLPSTTKGRIPPFLFKPPTSPPSVAA